MEKGEDWEDVKTRLKQKFSDLTDGDLMKLNERQNELLVRLQGKLGMTREEITRLLFDL